MKNSLVLMFALFLIPCSVKAQNLSEDETARKHVPLSIEQLLSQQAVNATSEPDSESLNKRLALLSRHSQDYLLGPGDVVEVSVFGIPELNQKSLSLDSKGRILLPFIDEVQLLGLAARDAEVKIATLLEASILNDPQVTVKVTEYKSQFFNVLGSVQRPGTYQLTRQMSLVDAISLAGGLEKDADYSRVYIHRVPSGEDEPDDGKAAGIPVSSEPNGYSETIEVDLEDLLVVGNHRLNIPIYSRDVITVPEREGHYYYVLGDVQKSGAFQIRRNERITLSKALATAGGMLDTASANKTTIMRREPDGSSATQIAVNVNDVMKGKANDVELARNDVIIVPGSTTKRIGKNLLNGISGIFTSLLIIGAQ